MQGGVGFIRGSPCDGWHGDAREVERFEVQFGVVVEAVAMRPRSRSLTSSLTAPNRGENRKGREKHSLIK